MLTWRGSRLGRVLWAVLVSAACCKWHTVAPAWIRWHSWHSDNTGPGMWGINTGHHAADTQIKSQVKRRWRWRCSDWYMWMWNMIPRIQAETSDSVNLLRVWKDLLLLIIRCLTLRSLFTFLSFIGSKNISYFYQKQVICIFPPEKLSSTSHSLALPGSSCFVRVCSGIISLDPSPKLQDTGCWNFMFG